MLTGMQMKAVFTDVMRKPAAISARIAYIVGNTGPNGGVILLGIWLPRTIIHANDNRMKR